jgi:hypothetical protein
MGAASRSDCKCCASLYPWFDCSMFKEAYVRLKYTLILPTAHSTPDLLHQRDGCLHPPYQATISPLAQLGRYLAY